MGLLVARRVLTTLKLADTYVGCEEPTGEDYNVEAVEDGPRAFYCLLDTGLKRTSTGSKVFAALKGALDGGLDIPHNEKRFVGYAGKELDAEVLQKYIYGGHVAEYQETMQVRAGMFGIGTAQAGQCSRGRGRVQWTGAETSGQRSLLRLARGMLRSVAAVAAQQLMLAVLEQRRVCPRLLTGVWLPPYGCVCSADSACQWGEQMRDQLQPSCRHVQAVCRRAGALRC